MKLPDKTTLLETAAWASLFAFLVRIVGIEVIEAARLLLTAIFGS